MKAHRARTLKAVAGNGSVTAEQMEIKSFASRAGAGDDGARHPGKSDGILCATKAIAIGSAEAVLH